MSSYIIDNILNSDRVDASKVNLWIWHVNKVPPHIGISSDNRYFSLKANGKDENVSLDSIQSILNKKTIATLCIELDLIIPADKINNVFDEYLTTVAGEVTCLNPIKNILDLKSASKLIELLEGLYDSESVSRAIGFNIPSDFQGIQDYSLEDIHDRLTKLSNGK